MDTIIIGFDICIPKKEDAPELFILMHPPMF